MDETRQDSWSGLRAVPVPAGGTHPWFDPDGLLEGTLRSAPQDAPGPAAEDILLAWLLRLPVEADPAVAAGGALRTYGPPTDASPAPAHRLFMLLEKTRRYPRSRLASLRPRRRPGRSDA